jgi:hypothetical protein
MLPPSLVDVYIRAQLVKEINGPFIQGSDLSTLDVNEKTIRLDKVGTISKGFIQDINYVKARINIALRIWSGCLDAAKSIAFETNEGPVSQRTRSLSFFVIDHWANRDLIYASGVQCAPAFKKLLNQYYTFNGVPFDSVVRSFPNEFLRDG